MTKLIIDRFEGDKAVCEREDQAMVDVPRAYLPKEAKEGDGLICEGGAYRIDEGETNERAERIARKMGQVFKG
jgi:hypothetical protein